MEFLTGILCNNGGSLASSRVVCADIVIKVKVKNTVWCEVADDSVVVKKFRPVKAGNSVEDKIETTLNLFEWL